MKIRRLLSILITLVLCMGIAGCGETENGSESGSSQNNTSNSGETEVEKPMEYDTEYLDSLKAPDYPEIKEDVKYVTYYFDSVNGDDQNDGLSKTSPKKTLNEASRMIERVNTKQPSKFLFKAGSVFDQEMLVLNKFKATKEAPLIVANYDATEENKYAKIIIPNDRDGITVNRGNLRLSGFELTGPKAYRGIHCITNKEGALANLVISDNYCHDINFDLGGKTLPTDGSMPDSRTVLEMCENARFSYNCGGISLEAETSKAVGPSWYENVWIDDNVIERIARTGIWMFSNWAMRPGVPWGNNPYYNDETNWFPHKNVNIRRNSVLFSGGDGIILGAAIDSFIEGNYCTHAQILGRGGYYCAGIWSHSCKNVVFQYNESSYTHTGRDGEGFDIDIGNSNIIFQYNYSHHNDGGGLLCCNTRTEVTKYDENGELILDEDGLPIIESVMGPWHDVFVRNNVFTDNRVGDFTLSGTVNDVIFDNNTVIKPGIDKVETAIKTQDFYTGLPGDRWTFSNNIFYMRKPTRISFSMEFSTTYTFNNNIYYGFGIGADEQPFDKYFTETIGEMDYHEIDPMFKSTEAGDGFEYALNMIPQNDACYSGGYKAQYMLKHDICGNNVEGLHYYGAIGKKSAN